MWIMQWNWKNKASLLWYDYASDLINEKNSFLIICDFQEHGLSGFLIAKLNELPCYYNSKYEIKIEEFYIRPKERSPELFQSMVSYLIQEVKTRFQVSPEEKLTLRIDSLESDSDLIQELFGKKIHRSSVTHTIKI